MAELARERKIAMLPALATLLAMVKASVPLPLLIYVLLEQPPLFPELAHGAGLALVQEQERLPAVALINLL